MKTDLPTTSHYPAAYLGLSPESLIFSLKKRPGTVTGFVGIKSCHHRPLTGNKNTFIDWMFEAEGIHAAFLHIRNDPFVSSIDPKSRHIGRGDRKRMNGA